MLGISSNQILQQNVFNLEIIMSNTDVLSLEGLYQECLPYRLITGKWKPLPVICPQVSLFRWVDFSCYGDSQILTSRSYLESTFSYQQTFALTSSKS